MKSNKVHYLPIKWIIWRIRPLMPRVQQSTIKLLRKVKYPGSILCCMFTWSISNILAAVRMPVSLLSSPRPVLCGTLSQLSKLCINAARGLEIGYLDIKRDLKLTTFKLWTFCARNSSGSLWQWQMYPFHFLSSLIILNISCTR